MDGLILIRSSTRSNQVARMQTPEGVVVSYHRALRRMAEIMLSHLRNNEGYKEPASVEGIGRASSIRLAFRKH
jgi:hypothetical protein